MVEADDTAFENMTRALEARAGTDVPVEELMAMWDAVRTRVAP